MMRNYKYFTRQQWHDGMVDYLEKANAAIAEIEEDFAGRTLTFIDTPKIDRYAKMCNQRDFCLEELERLSND